MAEPPIQNLDQVDVFGERKDGGADLVISVSGPLDASPETLKLLESKITAYITAVASEGFRRKYTTNKSRIIVSCAYPVSQPAHEIMDRLATSASQYCMGLEFRETLQEH